MLNRCSIRFLSSSLLAFSVGLTVACTAGNNTETTSAENGDDTTALQECTVMAIEDITVTSETPDEVAIAETDAIEGDAAVGETAAETAESDDTSAAVESNTKTEETVVKLDCSGEVVTVPWRQFRRKLKVNPKKFRDRLVQFQNRVACFQSPDLRDNQLLCQKAQQKGTEEFQILRIKNFD